MFFLKKQKQTHMKNIYRYWYIDSVYGKVEYTSNKKLRNTNQSKIDLSKTNSSKTNLHKTREPKNIVLILISVAMFLIALIGLTVFLIPVYT